MMYKTVLVESLPGWVQELIMDRIDSLTDYRDDWLEIRKRLKYGTLHQITEWKFEYDIQEIVKELDSCEWDDGDNQTWREEQSQDNLYNMVKFTIKNFSEGTYDKIKRYFWQNRDKDDYSNDDVDVEAYITFYDNHPYTAYIQLALTKAYDCEILVHENGVKDDSPDYWKMLERKALNLLYADEMEGYGKLPTDEEYNARIGTDASLYDILLETDKIWCPYLVDSHGAPLDGSPEAPFRTQDLAVEYIKRQGGVVFDDYAKWKWG